MHKSPIEPPFPDNIDQRLDREDQVLSPLNQDGRHTWSDLDGLVQAVDDKEQVAVRTLDPPRIR